jgi:RimJ/RimL family protein N-acetyltransferase
MGARKSGRAGPGPGEVHQRVHRRPSSGSPVPPERIRLPGLELRRVRESDASMLAASVAANLDHLAAWLVWARPAEATLQAQVARLPRTVARWREGISFQYLLLDPITGTHLGNAGLERRAEPEALEIGYWLARSATGHGHATTAARVLTEVALGLPGVERVEIHCDEANLRSRLVPTRLGYRLHRVEDDPVRAPADSGRRMIWVYPP